MERIEKLKNWYETLTEDSLQHIGEFYHVDSYFKDPFNEFSSRDRIQNIFGEMFEKLKSPRFVFLDIVDNDDQTFITWDFLFEIGEKPYKIHGSTFLKWNDGKIHYHRDYWDVGEELLLKIPVIRSLYGGLRKKLSH